MLVLTRRRNESIVVSNVTFTIVDIRMDKVRVGIDAPRDVEVHRQEVWEAIHGRDSSADASPAVTVTDSETSADPKTSKESIWKQQVESIAEAILEEAGNRMTANGPGAAAKLFAGAQALKAIGTLLQEE